MYTYIRVTSFLQAVPQFYHAWLIKRDDLWFVVQSQNGRGLLVEKIYSNAWEKICSRETPSPKRSLSKERDPRVARRFRAFYIEKRERDRKIRFLDIFIYVLWQLCVSIGIRKKLNEMARSEEMSYPTEESFRFRLYHGLRGTLLNCFSDLHIDCTKALCGAGASKLCIYR